MFRTVEDERLEPFGDVGSAVDALLLGSIQQQLKREQPLLTVNDGEDGQPICGFGVWLNHD